jgi:U3 small nucleolar RNA-associated protein 7
MIGKGQGVESVVIPGAGEPNYDSLVANPFESTKERREAEVHKLLDKLDPETIALDADFIGAVDADTVALKKDLESLEQVAPPVLTALAGCV